MLLPIYASAIIAALFYILLPGYFALRLSAGWRSFRGRVRLLLSAPRLDYLAAAKGREGAWPGERVWRMDGSVEAIEGADRLWLRSASVSAIVDFSGSPIFVLARRSPDLPYDSIERAGAVQRLRWNQVHSLPEGTRLFVAGRVSFSGSAPTFRGDDQAPLVAVLHDESEESFFPSLISGARSRNELWSRSTFLIWAVGIFMSSLVSVWTSGVSTLDSIRFLSWLIALSPVLPFLPPGMLFLILARSAWRASLLGRMWAESEPDQRKTEASGKRIHNLSPAASALLAVGSAAAAFALNLVLAFAAWRLLS